MSDIRYRQVMEIRPYGKGGKKKKKKERECHAGKNMMEL